MTTKSGSTETSSGDSGTAYNDELTSVEEVSVESDFVVIFVALLCALDCIVGSIVVVMRLAPT